MPALQSLSVSAALHVSSLAARHSGPFFSACVAKRSRSLLMYPGRDHHGMPGAWKSEKHAAVCFFLPAQQDALCARLPSMSGLLGGYVAEALWAADGQKMSCEQQAVLFAAVADAVS